MLNKEYWDAKWRQGKSGWDLGHPSPPLMHYIRTSISPDSRILLPGSGRGYEAGTAFREGFSHVYYNDISPYAVQEFRELFPDFPENQILLQDFYSIEEKFDYCLEQTSFCAQPPSRRSEYLYRIKEILHPDGVYAGVFFNVEFPFEGPPFGGTREEYETLFSKYFKIIKMEKCYNSVKPRIGSELFVISTPK